MSTLSSSNTAFTAPPQEGAVTASQASARLAMDRNGAGYPGCVSDGGAICVDAGHLVEVRTPRL